MPCSKCSHWIAEESQVYTVDIVQKSSDDDGDTCYVLRSLDGTERFRVATLDVETISKTLQVRGKRIEITTSQNVVHIRAEELRWRLCEMWPLHQNGYLSMIVVSAHQSNPNACWYFICEKCRDKNPEWENYTNINYEGAESTASEDENSEDENFESECSRRFRIN